jgi:hypothetical protein
LVEIVWRLLRRAGHDRPWRQIVDVFPTRSGVVQQLLQRDVLLALHPVVEIVDGARIWVLLVVRRAPQRDLPGRPEPPPRERRSRDDVAGAEERQDQEQ